MSAHLPDPSALLASLLNLMTRFSCLGCPQQALLIQRELALLQHYPDEQLAPLIKQVGQRLESEWGLLHLAIPALPFAPRLDYLLIAEALAHS